MTMILKKDKHLLKSAVDQVGNPMNATIRSDCPVMVDEHDHIYSCNETK